MSHHSSDDHERDAAMSAMMSKIFGEYPDGKLNAQDEGAVACAIGHQDGRVVLKFPKPVAWIGFTAAEAMEIAQSLIEHARAAGLTAPFTLKL